MRKYKFFNTFFKKINSLISKLLKKYLNNLKLNISSNKTKINKLFSILIGYLNKLKLYISFNKAKTNKLFPILLIFVFLVLSYLLLPSFYDKKIIQTKFQNQLNQKLDLDFNLSNNFKYNIFPKPHFTFINSTILDDQFEIAKVQKLKINVFLSKFFSIDSLMIKDISINNANFNLDKKNFKLFVNLINKNFKNGILAIKDSNIFFRNKNDEVLFINKVNNLKYFYDNKKLKNFVISKNEIFNLPYSIKIYNDNDKKKLFSSLNFRLLNLQIENELDYNSNLKKGSTRFNLDKKKIISEYQLINNKFLFLIFDRLKDSNFSYKGEVNIKPFFSSLTGETKKINPFFFLNNDSLFLQLLKTEILNSQNLNFNLNITANEVKNFQNFNKFILRSKIEDGFIDIDNSSLTWRNYVDFAVVDSLIYVEDSELILSGKLNLKIKDNKQVYKFLLTPKNYRLEIKNIKTNFIYNFDQKTMSLYNIKVDEETNSKIDKALNTLIFKNNKLQNKIYIKNQLNKAIKIYAG